MAPISLTPALMSRLLGMESAARGGASSASSSPVSAAGGDKISETGQNAGIAASFDQTDIVVTSLNRTSQNLQTVLDALGRSLVTLQGAREATNAVIALLEEAGGVTVRARDTLKTAAGYEGNKDRLGELETRFTAVLERLDAAVDKGATRGVNLLKGDTLATAFDTEGKSQIVTNGLDLTSRGLEFRTPDFSSPASVQDSRIDVMNAIDIATTLRNQISSDIMLVQTRQDFSENAIAAMAMGSASIQQADMTDEAASLLALQVRQFLGETTEPLASPAQDQLLRHFLA